MPGQLRAGWFDRKKIATSTSFLELFRSFVDRSFGEICREGKPGDPSPHFPKRKIGEMRGIHDR